MNYYLLPILLFSFSLLTLVTAQESVFGFLDYNLLQWDENRKLTWDDFQGNPFSSSYSSPYSAYTVWYVSYDFSWELSNEQGCYYKFTKILATANFDKSKSWVKKGQESDFILKHEQGHFDIAQILAEEFNERVQSELMGKEFPCPGGRNDSNAITNHARNKVQNIFSQEHQIAQQMNRDYDAETKGAEDSSNTKQIEWDNKIQSLLDVERQVQQTGGNQIGGNQVDFLKQIIQSIQSFLSIIFG